MSAGIAVVGDAVATSAAPDLALTGVRLSYRSSKGGEHQVLDVGEWRVGAGSMVAIGGASGGGKTCLIYLLAGIEVPSAGRVVWHDTVLSSLSEAARDAWRRAHVGMIFQGFHLVPGLSARDNVLLPPSFDHMYPPAAYVRRAEELLAHVGIRDHHQPVTTLSRGEQQRVALARALLRRPAIILADEPTASLDATNGAAVGEMLVAAAREQGSTLIVTTHDQALLGRLDQRFELAKGQLQRVT
jgi:putative ABC transport system ATP-binding protein